MAHTLIPPGPRHGHPGYVPVRGRSPEQDTVVLRRGPRARRAPTPRPPWAAPTTARPYVAQPNPAAPPPWGAVHGWAAPGRRPLPPAENPNRTAQRWLVFAVGVTVTTVATVAAIAGLAGGHGGARTTATGHDPTPVVKATPAPRTASPAPAPPPSAGSLVGDAALPTLLPTVAEVAQVMGSAGLAPIDGLNGPGMFTDKTDPAQCVGAVVPVARAAYSGSAAQSTYTQALHDSDPATLHTVFNGVTTFPLEASAADFVDQQSVAWQGCRASAVVMGPDAEKPVTWMVQDVARRGDTLTASISVRDGNGSCQRALTAKRNVVIDVTACSDHPVDEAMDLTARIAARIGQST